MPTDSWLDKIQVAAPCSADWNEMNGDERVRFCALCKKNVYNISEMSRAEAEALIKEKEGRLCIQFSRRADGTVITDNCPVGLRAIRRRLRWIQAGIAAGFAFVTAFFAFGRSANGQSSNAATARPAPRLFGWGQQVQRQVFMGKVCPVRVTPPVPPQASAGNQNSNQSSSSQ